MIEAQGRTNLHSHAVLWVWNTPDCLAMIQFWKEPDNLRKLNDYIRDVIQAHVPGLSEDRAMKSAPVPHPSWRRPPNPSAPTFESDALDAERAHVETSQIHKCIPPPHGCAQRKADGSLKCKRGHPFELSDKCYVASDGSWCVSTPLEACLCLLS